MNNYKFQEYNLTGDFFEIGNQHGILCKEKIDNAITLYADLMKKSSNLTWKNALNISEKFIPFIRKYNPEAILEMEGIAKGAKRKFNEILILNIRSELIFLATSGGIVSDGCSTVAVMPNYFSSNQLILAQNWDWMPPQCLENTVILKNDKKMD